jgi:UPF0755 protein
MGRLIRRLSVAVALLAALGGGAAAWLWQSFTAPGPLAADKTVVLPKGASLDVIARALAREGVIEHPFVFVAGITALGETRRLKAGEYRFDARISPREAMELLLSGRTVVRRLTVAEGLTVAEVLRLVDATDGLAGDLPPPPPEGSLLPETYHFSYGDERAQLVERMRRGLREALVELWETRPPGLPYRTPDEALVMASIVEKETGRAEERPLVASVFVNRLRRGIRLQSDPTVIYGLTGGRGPFERALTRADLDEATQWNTYRIDGLPPTPIANPGRASLQAALRPAETNYLYFVADGSGGHAFAATLDEHNRNVRLWRRQQNGRR